MDLLRWPELASADAGKRKAAGCGGFINIEPEDEDFNGSEGGEKRGLIAGRSFLENT